MQNRLSFQSRNSVLSLWSSGSVLSIGSVGSALSVGSVGSFASFVSIGSSMSRFSVLSHQSDSSVLSNQSSWSVLASQTKGALPLLIVPAVVTAATSYVLVRRTRGWYRRACWRHGDPTGVDAVRANKQAILTTIKQDGRPQLSNVLAGVGDDGLIRVSTTADRAKYANLRRTPWAAIHVNGESFWSYAVVEGDVTTSAVVADAHDEAAEELVELYRALAGEHEDWEDHRAALVRDRRVVVRVTPTHAYGMLR